MQAEDVFSECWEAEVEVDGPGGVDDVGGFFLEGCKSWLV
jgi:hypothetical protein